MTAPFIPSDALIVRPRPRRQRGALIAFLGLMSISAVGGLVRSIQAGTSVGYVFTAVTFGMLGVLFPLLIAKTREQLVAISDTHVFVRNDKEQNVLRSNIAAVKRERIQDTLRGADGGLLLRLPDTLTAAQGHQVAVLLGVPHVDRRGRLIAESAWTGAAGPDAMTGPDAPGALPVPPPLWTREP